VDNYNNDSKNDLITESIKICYRDYKGMRAKEEAMSLHDLLTQELRLKVRQPTEILDITCAELGAAEVLLTIFLAPIAQDIWKFVLGVLQKWIGNFLNKPRSYNINVQIRIRLDKNDRGKIFPFRIGKEKSVNSKEIVQKINDYFVEMKVKSFKDRFSGGSM